MSTASNNDLATRLYKELSAHKADYIALGPINVRPDRRDVIVFDKRKYYNQAHNYHYVLILAAQGKEFPPFTICIFDVSRALKEELVALQTFELQRVLVQAIIRIFHDIDENYNSVFEGEEEDEQKQHSGIFLAKEIAVILRVELQ